MTTITFDTLKFANTLKAAGVNPAQAEAEATAISEVLEVNLKELVTKEDLLSTRDDLRRDIDDLRRDMDARLIQMEQRLIIKLGTLMAVSIGIVAALVNCCELHGQSLSWYVAPNSEAYSEEQKLFIRAITLY